MLTNDSLLIVLLDSDTAHISQVALNDPNLPAQELGILVYLCNAAHNDSPVKLIGDRFGRSRYWWSRHFKKLKELGYAKYHKTSKGFNKFESYYIITDDPAQLKNLDISKLILSRSQSILQPPPPPPPPKKIEIETSLPQPKHQPIPTPASKQREVREQLKWVDPLMIGQADYELCEFYLSHNYPIPKNPNEWEEAKKPGMQLFAEVTNSFPGWNKATYINMQLGATPNKKALESAWTNWITIGFREGNVKGILDWYKAFCNDPEAEPWSKNRSAKNGQRYSRTNKNVRREHGTATTPGTDTEFVAIE